MAQFIRRSDLGYLVQYPQSNIAFSGLRVD